jgi:hypothetical protein
MLINQLRREMTYSGVGRYSGSTLSILIISSTNLGLARLSILLRSIIVHEFSNRKAPCERWLVYWQFGIYMGTIEALA